MPYLKTYLNKYLEVSTCKERWNVRKFFSIRTTN
jgi:hypothetical protein